MSRMSMIAAEIAPRYAEPEPEPDDEASLPPHPAHDPREVEHHAYIDAMLVALSMPDYPVPPRPADMDARTASSSLVCEWILEAFDYGVRRGRETAASAAAKGA